MYVQPLAIKFKFLQDFRIFSNTEQHARILHIQLKNLSITNTV